MKNILIILLCAISLSAIAQSDTVTLVGDQIKWHQEDTKTWVFTIPQDTLTDEDTIFAGGDTLLITKDTAILEFPNNFGDAFAGWLVFETDTIGALDSLVGSYRIFQSACDGCTWVPVIASTALTSAAPAQFTKTFDLHGIRLRIVFWIASGTGSYNGNLVLKRSSLSSD